MPSMEHLYRCSLANKEMVRCSSSVFRAKSQNNEKSNTELELFELHQMKINICHKFCVIPGCICEQSDCLCIALCILDIIFSLLLMMLK